jgi:hypothetical protein
MTQLESVHNSSSGQAPVADDGSGLRQSFRRRLTQAFDTAEKLREDAEWLRIDTENLRVDLTKIADPDVVDSVTWLHNATMNVEGEFDVLIERLLGFVEALNTNTD